VLGGQAGLRPGWCRVSLHWAMEREEVDFLIEAVEFLADHGWRFAARYEHDLASGAWHWRGEAPAGPAGLSASLLDTAALPEAVPLADRHARFAAALKEARQFAQDLAPADLVAG
jgi:hypothetical protein